MSYPKGVCPACGVERPTRRDGTMMMHQPPPPGRHGPHPQPPPKTCPGSGKPAKEK